MRKAEPIAGLGGLALFVSLFLTWYRTDPPFAMDGATLAYGASIQRIFVLVSVTGWQAFTVIDVLLALFALLFLAVPLSTLLTRGPAKSIGTAVLASAFGWIAVVLVLFRLVFVPDGFDVAAGAWVALAGALVGWVGSWLSMRDESTPGAKAPVVPVLDA